MTFHPTYADFAGGAANRRQAAGRHTPEAVAENAIRAVSDADVMGDAEALETLARGRLPNGWTNQFLPYLGAMAEAAAAREDRRAAAGEVAGGWTRDAYGQTHWPTDPGFAGLAVDPGRLAAQRERAGDAPRPWDELVERADAVAAGAAATQETITLAAAAAAGTDQLDLDLHELNGPPTKALTYPNSTMAPPSEAQTVFIPVQRPGLNN